MYNLPSLSLLLNEVVKQSDAVAGVTAAERPLPVGFPWPNPTCPVALVPCDFGQEQTGMASLHSPLD